MKIRLALFISGSGTTACAILKACTPGGLLYGLVDPVLVISSRKTATGIKNVLETKVLTEKDVKVVRSKDCKDKNQFGEALLKECGARGVDLFGQYGWLEKTPENFLEIFPLGINQHPAPLYPGHPDFGGHRMFGRACHAARLLFVREVGRDFRTAAVAQRVHPEYDKGKLLRQQWMDIGPRDDIDTMRNRLLLIEHEVQIQTLLDFARDRVKEIPGEELVRDQETAIWRNCCRAGKNLYPKG